MSDNVKKFRPRLHSTRFGSKFPRLRRENTQLSDGNITDKLKPYYPPRTERDVYGIAKEAPSDDLRFEMDLDVNKILSTSNTLLIYRILKLLYKGKPDILGAAIPLPIPTGQTNTHTLIPYTLEWGYTIQVRDWLTAEIRTIHANTTFRIRFWVPKNKKISLSEEEFKEARRDFLVSLNELVQKNLHLFNEDDALRDSEIKQFTAGHNVFMENYNAAQRLRELAVEYDINPTKGVLKKTPLEYTEPLSVDTPGYIYTSSAILFIISLESLINLLYFYQLKGDYRQEAYNRLTKRGDLDLRLATIHLFCEGFQKQPIPPGSDLWKTLIKLRNFRNSIFHGNKADEHNIHLIGEDYFSFTYSPRIDFRGIKKSKIRERHFPVAMIEIEEDVVSEIVQIVDDVIESLLAAMDVETRAWVDSWLWQAVINPRRLADLRVVES